MKSNTLLVSILKANSKVPAHCSNLMICRKKKIEFWRNYCRSRNGLRESLLQITPKINIVMEHVSFTQRFSIKTWKPKILWAKPKNMPVPFGQKHDRVFGLVFFIFFFNKSRIFSYLRKLRSTEISSEVYRYYLLFPKYMADTGEYVSLSNSARELLIFH